MKKNILSLALILTLFLPSCVEKFSNPTEPEKSEIIENMISTSEYKVPVKDGFTTNVMYKGALVASTSKPMTILLPRQTATKSADDVTVIYQEGISFMSASTLWQTLVFEDSRKGDYDYNDLVFRARYQTSNDNFRVSIQPIALGSTKDIKLGFVWTQGSQKGEAIVADICRSDLFEGKTGFINSFDYVKHYNDFAKVIDIPISSVSEPVNVWWFIEVDNGFRINAINTIGNKCLDEQKRPFGFAISDCSVNPISKASKMASTNYDESEWNEKIVPKTFDWAKIPPVPTIPSHAVPMSQYQKDKKTPVYKLEAGQTYNGDLVFNKNLELYVQGTLTLKTFWGNGPATIYILPGGKLEIATSASIQNVEIINYGEITTSVGSISFNKASFKSQGDLILPSSITLENTTQFYVSGRLVANGMTLQSNKSEFYVGDIELKDDNNNLKKLYMTNGAEGFVEGRLLLDNLEMDSNSQLYVGCRLECASSVSFAGAASLSVKGYISVPTLSISSSGTINIMNGGVLECVTFKMGNTPSVDINVIGTEFGVIKAHEFFFHGALNLTKVFNGKIYFEYGSLNDTRGSIKLDDPQFKLPPADSFIPNDPNASLGSSDCSPGYNSGGKSDEITWFAYPLEGTNISTCYDFESWMKGIFDFQQLPGAKVFDIYNTNPKEGEQLSVYQMK